MPLFIASISGDTSTPQGRRDLVAQLDRLLDVLEDALAMTDEEEPVVEAHDQTRLWLKNHKETDHGR